MGHDLTALTNGELLVRAGTGDEAAWEMIVDRFGRLVWSVARSFRLDPATAADVSQTTWLRLVENLDRIRQPERLAGWLAATTRNEALRLIRQNRRILPTLDIEGALPPVVADPGAALVDTERQAQVIAALSALSERCQQLLRLLTTDPPLDYAEIAGIIDCPIGSIGPTRARCLEHLRRRMAAANPTEHRLDRHE